MSNTIKDEKVLVAIKSHKNIKKSTVIGNLAANLFSRGIAGRVTNDFKLTLTEENLYIEAIGYATWGGLQETMYEEKISREDIKSFEVKKEGEEEIITITTAKNKEMIFIRDNEKKDDLASVMAELLSMH